MIEVINFFTNPFIEIYEDIWEQPTIWLKMFQAILLLWVVSLAVLFVTGWSYLVFQFITNPSQFSNATFGVFDTLG